jgi:hypothetical protein
LWMKLCTIAFSRPVFFFISANFKCHQRQHNSDQFFFLETPVSFILRRKREGARALTNPDPRTLES